MFSMTPDVMKDVFLDVAKQQVTMDPEQLHRLTRSAFVDALGHDTSVRGILCMGAIMRGNDLLKDDVIEEMQARVLEIIRHERARHFPEVDKAERAPDPDSPPAVVIPAKKDLTLRELAGLLAPGQDERFVKETLSPEMLAFAYDMGADPLKYAQGKINQMVFKILAKVAKPIDMANALLSTNQFIWKDDGLTHNRSFEIYQGSRTLAKSTSMKM